MRGSAPVPAAARRPRVPDRETRCPATPRWRSGMRASRRPAGRHARPAGGRQFVLQPAQRAARRPAARCRSATGRPSSAARNACSRLRVLVRRHPAPVPCRRARARSRDARQRGASNCVDRRLRRPCAPARCRRRSPAPDRSAGCAFSSTRCLPFGATQVAGLQELPGPRSAAPADCAADQAGGTVGCTKSGNCGAPAGATPTVFWARTPTRSGQDGHQCQQRRTLRMGAILPRGRLEPAQQTPRDIGHDGDPAVAHFMLEHAARDDRAGRSAPGPPASSGLKSSVTRRTSSSTRDATASISSSMPSPVSAEMQTAPGSISRSRRFSSGVSWSHLL